MPLDPSIFNQIQAPDYAGAFGRGMQLGESIQDRPNRLADLAAQRELRQQQVTQGRQEIEAYPQKQAAEAEKLQFDRQARHASIIKDVMKPLVTGDSSPQSLLNAYNTAKQYGVPEDVLKAQFSNFGNLQDPAQIKQIAAGHAMTIDQWLKQNAPESLFAKIDPSKFTPESIQKFSTSRNYNDLQALDKTGGGGDFSKIEPSKFTSQSIAKFAQTKDYSVLVPRKETELPEAKMKRIQDIEMKLADDYRTESKGWAETSTAMKKTLKAIETADKNPGSALAAGTGFMKILDPNSVVRETELGMALSASGWFDRALNVAEKLQSGVVMTSEQQKQLMNAALDLFEEAKAAQLEIDKVYTERAMNYGANPRNVISQRGQNLPDIRKQKPKSPVKIQSDSAKDQEAISWARANRNDPRAVQILKLHGM